MASAVVADIVAASTYTQMNLSSNKLIIMSGYLGRRGHETRRVDRRAKIVHYIPKHLGGYDMGRWSGQDEPK